MTLLKLLLAVGLLYLVYCAALFLLQRQLLFPGTGIRPPSQTVEMAGVTRLWLNTGSAHVEAWLLGGVTGPASPGPGVIFAHGNGELIDYWADIVQNLRERGLSVLLVEYPGYGRSEGKPTQDSIAATFVKAYDFLAARPEVDSRRIVLWGRSLGGGAVCTLLSQRPAAALILLSTFTSVRSMASRFLAPPFLVADPFDNLAVVQGFHGPILIAHGKSDRIIPFEHARRLHQAAPQSRLLVYDCGHNDCPPDWGEFFDEVESFLREEGILQGR